MFFPINNQQSIRDINKAFNSTQHNGNGLNTNANYFLEPHNGIKDKFRQNPKNAKQITISDESESDESDESNSQSEYDESDESDENDENEIEQKEIHEELLKLRREHYNDNKQHILELQKLSRYRCECGSDVKSKDKQIHLRSKKHRLFCFEKKQD
jgi:hypothetical protein